MLSDPQAPFRERLAQFLAAARPRPLAADAADFCFADSGSGRRCSRE